MVSRVAEVAEAAADFAGDIEILLTVKLTCKSRASGRKVGELRNFRAGPEFSRRHAMRRRSRDFAKHVPGFRRRQLGAIGH